jgi:hypothetical protein
MMHDYNAEDGGAPEIVQIATRTVTVRKERPGCRRHTLRKGDRVEQWIGLVDGEFTVDEQCPHCMDEALREDDAEIRRMVLEQERDELEYERIVVEFTP